MKVFKDKVGEISSSFIVGFIITLAAGIILLSIFYQIDFGSEIDDQTCHESVILRGSLPSIGEVQSFIPLKCKTEKFCISGNKKDKCDEEYSGSKDVNVVKVNNDLDISKFLSKEVVDCWVMLGEGKVSLYSPSIAKKLGAGTVSSSCVICSRIAYDESSLSEKNVKIEDVDVWRYMKSHKMPLKDVSYYDFLAEDGTKVSIKGVPDYKLQESNKKGNNVESKLGDYEDSKNIDDELAVVFMQVSTVKHKEAFKNAVTGAGALWGVSAYLAPVKTIVGTIKNAPVIAVIAGVLLGAQQLNVARNNAIAYSYCSDVKIGSEDGMSCSTVRTVKYDVKALSKICGSIESL